MKNFDYFNVQSKVETLNILKKERENACLVAGGTNIMPNVRAEKLNDKTLVNIRNLGELHFIKDSDDKIVIGPLTTITDLEKSPVIEKYAHSLFQAAHDFADPTTRNSATIGGNIANASPAADTATPLLACNAAVKVESAERGERTICIKEFFRGVGKTALEPDEMITAIEIKKNTANSNSQFIKLGLRNAMAISLISIAVGLETKEGKVQEINVSLGSVAPTPVRAINTEKYLQENGVTDEAIEKAKKIVTEEISPIDDIRASAEYRREVAGVLLERALKKAMEN